MDKRLPKLRLFGGLGEFFLLEDDKAKEPKRIGIGGLNFDLDAILSEEGDADLGALIDKFGEDVLILIFGILEDKDDDDEAGTTIIGEGKGCDGVGKGGEGGVNGDASNGDWYWLVKDSSIVVGTTLILRERSLNILDRVGEDFNGLTLNSSSFASIDKLIKFSNGINTSSLGLTNWSNKW